VGDRAILVTGEVNYCGHQGGWSSASDPGNRISEALHMAVVGYQECANESSFPSEDVTAI
jgi:hypothetical protein